MVLSGQQTKPEPYCGPAHGKHTVRMTAWRMRMAADAKEYLPMPARILLIEDDPASMELMAYQLRACGFDTFYAHDETEGLELAGLERPDLIVCDVHLPHLDGYALARRLSMDPALQDIPVIAMTAVVPDDEERLKVAGFDGYVCQATDPDAFIASIQHFLPREKQGKHRYQQQRSEDGNDPDR